MANEDPEVEPNPSPTPRRLLLPSYEQDGLLRISIVDPATYGTEAIVLVSPFEAMELAFSLLRFASHYIQNPNPTGEPTND